MKGSWLPGLLLIFTLLLLGPFLSVPQFHFALANTVSNTSPTIQFPPGVLDYVAINVLNSQQNPTPAPFQQKIDVDSATFGKYEASNLQNIEFFTSDARIIPSWLESGASNSSKDTIYWLKLASGISANSSLTIYMGFASKLANLLNTQTTGEAPSISATYGK